MSKEQEKIEIEVKIDSLQKEYRGLGDLVQQSRKELKGLEEWKESTFTAVEQQKEILNDVVNQIAAEKLEWSQLKAKEEADLNSKKAEIDAILAREKDLNKKEQDLIQKEENIKELLKKDDAILLESRQQHTQNQVVLQEAKDQQIENDADRAQLEKDKADFKKNTKLVLEKAISELE